MEVAAAAPAAVAAPAVRMLRALVLFSGGLDSILAAKITQDLGIETTGLYFDNPLVSLASERTSAEVAETAKDLGLPLRIEPCRTDYFQVLANPRFGYGKNFNPCLDCRIYQLRRAKELMQEEGAGFLVTGEVLGERPMSQRRDALFLIDREAGVKGLVLRPLSAKLLPPTLPEEKGWVRREELFGIQGRSRKPQMELAASLGIKKYPTPAGGCLLTSPDFAKKVRDLLAWGGELNPREIKKLKVGRHFRISPGVKAIVGRNQQENKELLTLAGTEDLIFKVKAFPGPVALAPAKASLEEKEVVASLTARYSDAPRHARVAVVSLSPQNGKEKEIYQVFPLTEKESEAYRIK